VITAALLLTAGIGSALADENPVGLPSEAIREYSVAPEGTELSSLALGPEGSIWFTESNPGRIARMSANGVLTAEFILPVSEEFQPYAPEQSDPISLALGPDSHMWFIDDGVNSEGRSSVGYVTPDGYVNEFVIPTPDSRPREIARGSDGNMWFTEEYPAGQIGRVTEAGVVTEVPVPEEFKRPLAIAQGADGNMWFTKQFENFGGQYYIGRVTPLGTVTELPLPAPFGPGIAIAPGPGGDVWFTMPGALGRITSAGAISEFPVSGVSGALDGLVAGADGNLWFTEAEGKLGRLTPSGLSTDFLTAAEGGDALGAIAAGEDGYLWYTEGNRIVRLETPFAPSNEEPPSLSGETTEGQTLSVGNGSWSHKPSAYRYQWQTCDVSGASCASISGQDGATYALTAGDVGRSLRATVTASNIAGANTAVSSTSAVIRSTPRPPSSTSLPPPGEASPLIASSMTWNFGWTRRYTFVEALLVHDVPTAGVVEVACHGRGCGFEHWRSDAVGRRLRCERHGCKVRYPTAVHGTLNLVGLFKGSRLKDGARIVVVVAKAKSIGKSFAFTIQADEAPRVTITCLVNGPSKPGGSC
jgi:virginiamycin B lyase